MPSHHLLRAPMTAITHTVTVAAGKFTPGHLGELTAVMSFELVDAVLHETRRLQRRLQDLPSRVGIYFLLAMCLFPQVGYRLVRDCENGGVSFGPRSGSVSDRPCCPER